MNEALSIIANRGRRASLLPTLFAVGTIVIAALAISVIGLSSAAKPGGLLLELRPFGEATLKENVGEIFESKLRGLKPDSFAKAPASKDDHMGDESGCDLPIKTDQQTEHDQQIERDGQIKIAFNESSARTKWMVSYVLMIIVSVFAVIGSWWLIYLSLEDVIEGRKDWWRGSRILALSAVIWVGACAYSYRAAPWGILPKIGTQIDLLIAERLFDDMSRYQFWGEVTLTAALLSICLAITSTTSGHPKYAEAHHAIANPPGTTDDTQNQYIQYLARSFERLRVAIYMAAAMTAVAVYQLQSLYSWPLALLATGSSAAKLTPPDKPAGTRAAFEAALAGIGNTSSSGTAFGESKFFSDFVSDLTLGYGILFTLILGSMLLPVIIILRKRSWKLARAMYPGISATGSAQSHLSFLKDNMLTLSVSSQLGQLSAILAPTGAAAILNFIVAGPAQ